MERKPLIGFGDIDAVKVRSCMTMFDYLSANDIFGQVLDLFYDGGRCALTLTVLRQERCYIKCQSN